MSTLSSATWFTLSNLTLQGASLAAQVICIRQIAPGSIGIYQSAGLVGTYLAVSQLGIVNAMNREYPYLAAQGNTADARRVLATAQAYNLIVGLSMFVVFAALAVWGGSGSSDWRLSLLAVGAITLPRLYTSYLEGTFRGQSEFDKLARVRFIHVAAVFATLVLPLKLGFLGFLIRELVLAVSFAGLLHMARPASVLPRIDVSTFRSLLSMGWKLLLWNYGFQIAQSLPRTVLVALAGTTALGNYAPVNWMQLAFASVTGSLTAYVYPRLTAKYAVTGAPVGRQALGIAIRAMAALFPLAVLGALLVPAALRRYLTAYEFPLIAAQLALFAGLFESMVIATSSMIAMKAWLSMTMYIAGTLVLRGIAPAVGLHLCANPVTGVAVGSLASGMLSVPLTWLVVSHAERTALRENRSSASR